MRVIICEAIKAHYRRKRERKKEHPQPFEVNYSDRERAIAGMREVESRCTTCVVRCGGEVPTLGAVPSFFPRSSLGCCSFRLSSLSARGTACVLVRSRESPLARHYIAAIRSRHESTFGDAASPSLARGPPRRLSSSRLITASALILSFFRSLEASFIRSGAYWKPHWDLSAWFGLPRIPVTGTTFMLYTRRQRLTIRKNSDVQLGCCVDRFSFG